MKDLQFKIKVDASGARKAVQETSDDVDNLQKITADTSVALENAGTVSAEAFNEFGQSLQATGVELSNTESQISQTGGQVKETSGEAVTGADEMSGSIEGLAGRLSELPGPLGMVGTGVTGMTGALSKGRQMMTATAGTAGVLKVALLAIPLVAIATAAITLAKAWSSTQENADRLNRILEPLKFTGEMLWGVLQNLSNILVDSVIDAFKNPVQTIKDFGNALLENIINRGEGILMLLPRLGEAIKMAFSGDIAGAGKLAADAVGQVATGVENVTDKVGEMSQQVQDAYEKGLLIAEQGAALGGRLADLRVEIEEMENAQIISLERMNAEYEEMRALSRDSALNEEEKKEALQDAMDLLRSIKDERFALIDLQIEEARINASANDTDREAQRELNELIAQKDRAEAQYQRRLGRLTARLSRINEQESKNAEDRQQQLEQRAAAFRQLLQTEEELEQERFEQAKTQLQELLDENVISYEEYYDILEEMRAEREETEDAAEAERMEKNLERFREQSLSELEILEQQYNSEKAKLDELLLANKISQAEYYDFLGDIADNYYDGLQKLEDDYNKTNAEVQAEILGREIATLAARADSFKEFAQGVIEATIAMMITSLLTSMIRSLPFPFNVALAATAPVVGERLAEAVVPEFREGGEVTGGRQMIQVNEEGQEFVMNSRATREYMPLLKALNDGSISRHVAYQGARESAREQIYSGVSGYNENETVVRNETRDRNIVRAGHGGTAVILSELKEELRRNSEQVKEQNRMTERRTDVEIIRAMSLDKIIERSRAEERDIEALRVMFRKTSESNNENRTDEQELSRIVERVAASESDAVHIKQLFEASRKTSERSTTMDEQVYKKLVNTVSDVEHRLDSITTADVSRERVQERSSSESDVLRQVNQERFSERENELNSTQGVRMQYVQVHESVQQLAQEMQQLSDKNIVTEKVSARVAELVSRDRAVLHELSDKKEHRRDVEILIENPSWMRLENAAEGLQDGVPVVDARREYGRMLPEINALLQGRADNDDNSSAELFNRMSGRLGGLPVSNSMPMRGGAERGRKPVHEVNVILDIDEVIQRIEDRREINQATIIETS